MNTKIINTKKLVSLSTLIAFSSMSYAGGSDCPSSYNAGKSHAEKKAMVEESDIATLTQAPSATKIELTPFEENRNSVNTNEAADSADLYAAIESVTNTTEESISVGDQANRDYVTSTERENLIIASNEVAVPTIAPVKSSQPYQTSYVQYTENGPKHVEVYRYNGAVGITTTKPTGAHVVVEDANITSDKGSLQAKETTNQHALNPERENRVSTSSEIAQPAIAPVDTTTAGGSNYAYTVEHKLTPAEKNRLQGSANTAVADSERIYESAKATVADIKESISFKEEPTELDELPPEIINRMTPTTKTTDLSMGPLETADES